jgi:hypothetical protein
MQHIPPQQAKRRYFSLSAPLQETLFSDRTSDSIRKAAILGGVEEQSSLLARLTGYVLMGYLNPLGFKDELKNELGVSEETAKQVASQLDTEVFSLVSSDIRKLYPPTIKTPTATSYGFTPKTPSNTVSKEAEKRLAQEPSEFEKRFFKKKEEQKKEQEKVIAKKPKKEVEKGPEEKPKPFFEKHEIGEHNLKVFEKIHQKQKKLTNQIDEKQTTKSELPTPSQLKKEENEIPKDAISTVSKKINESMKATDSKIENKDPEKEKVNKKTEEPAIKPVMPLPTFMQSQFQPKRTASNRDPKLDGNVIDLRDL